MKKILLLVGLLVLILFFLAKIPKRQSLPSPGPTKACAELERLEMDDLIKISQEECQKCEGVWETLSMDISKTGCNPKTSDADKSCTDSEECVGLCLAEEEGDYGKCSAYKFNLGCHQTFLGGTKVMLCAD